MDTTAALQTVGSWPVADQLELVFRLWDQINDAGRRPTPRPDLLAEIDRRLAAYEADPGRVLTWDELVTHVRHRF